MGNMVSVVASKMVVILGPEKALALAEDIKRGVKSWSFGDWIASGRTLREFELLRDADIVASNDLKKLRIRMGDPHAEPLPHYMIRVSARTNADRDVLPQFVELEMNRRFREAEREREQAIERSLFDLASPEIWGTW